MLLFPAAGYDSQLPIDSMQGLDLGSQAGNQYMDDLNLGPHGDLSFPGMDGHPQMGGPQPQSGAGDAAGHGWFDTDL